MLTVFGHIHVKCLSNILQACFCLNKVNVRICCDWLSKSWWCVLYNETWPIPYWKTKRDTFSDILDVKADRVGRGYAKTSPDLLIKGDLIKNTHSSSYTDFLRYAAIKGCVLFTEGRLTESALRFQIDDRLQCSTEWNTSLLLTENWQSTNWTHRHLQTF